MRLQLAENVRALAAAGVGISAIRERVGVSAAFVRRIMRMHGLLPKSAPAAPWTDEHDKKLAAMVESGLTFSEIGRALERSRNSVAGRWHRIGVRQAPKPIKPAQVDNPVKAVPPRRTIEPSRATREVAALSAASEREPYGRGRAEAPQAPMPMPRPDSHKSASPVRIVDARHGQCRWVLDAKREGIAIVCADPTVGDESWCRHHLAIVKVSGSKLRIPPRSRTERMNGEIALAARDEDPAELEFGAAA